MTQLALSRARRVSAEKAYMAYHVHRAKTASHKNSGGRAGSGSGTGCGGGKGKGQGRGKGKGTLNEVAAGGVGKHQA